MFYDFISVCLRLVMVTTFRLYIKRRISMDNLQNGAWCYHYKLYVCILEKCITAPIDKLLTLQKTPEVSMS